MLKVGITGGIGSGKTLICKVFAHLGVPQYSSDTEARNIVNRNAHVKESIKTVFGKDVYDQDGNLDRKKIAGFVFNDKEKLEKLNSIVHPEVQTHFQNWLSLHKEQKYVLKEAAILIESGAYKELDFIITVVSPLELKIKRIMKRDGISREAILKVMENQMSDSEKIKLSDFVIVNDEKKLVIPQILKIHHQLTK